MCDIRHYVYRANANSEARPVTNIYSGIEEALSLPLCSSVLPQSYSLLSFAFVTTKLEAPSSD